MNENVLGTCKLVCESGNDKQRLAGAQVKKPRLYVIPHEKTLDLPGEPKRFRFNIRMMN